MTTDICGCCKTSPGVTSNKLYNRPGLAALAYRIGTFSSLRQELLELIANDSELSALKTRLSDDYTITLLELWSIVADILTFYQERIANEAFLRTATQRDSILRLARMLDYHLRSGVAATSTLAFTVEKDKTVNIPVGLRVQSVPGQDEKPQKFETLESIKADSSINTLQILPKPTPIDPFAVNRVGAFLMPDEEGIQAANSLSTGDELIFFDNSAFEEHSVDTIKIELDQIFLSWRDPIRTQWDSTPNVYKFIRKFLLFGISAPTQHLAPLVPNIDDQTVYYNIDDITIDPDDVIILQSVVDTLLSVPNLRLVIEGHTDNSHSEEYSLALSERRANAIRDWIVFNGVHTSRLEVIGYGLTKPIACNETEEGRALNRRAEAKFVPLVAEEFEWELQTTNFSRDENEYSLELDVVYEDLKPGAELLIVVRKNSNYFVIKNKIKECKIVSASRGPLADSVTQVIFNECILPGEIFDIRNVILFELEGSNIDFWSYAYPAEISEAELYIPGKKINKSIIEVARSIENFEYKSGLKINVKDLDRERKIILRDDTQKPVMANIKSAYIIDNNIVINSSVSDSISARELGLIPELSGKYYGLVSEVIPPTQLTDINVTINTAYPELMVTIGTIGPKLVRLVHDLTLVEFSNLAEEGSHAYAAYLLQSGINAADPSSEFGLARVVVSGDTLVVIPGVENAYVYITETENDRNTIKKLGLQPDRTRKVTGLLSASIPLDVFDRLPIPGVNTAPELMVTMGSVGPKKVRLIHDLTLVEFSELAAEGVHAYAAYLLQAGINVADQSVEFTKARVIDIDNRLLVLSGITQQETKDYLVLNVKTNENLNLDSRTAIMLGNVTEASHGETVSKEIIGDGNAAEKFQVFMLKKTPVTYTPYEGSSGVKNSLELYINNVRWHEKPSLYRKNNTDQIYITRINDDGEMSIQFGDGITGARLPSGRNNIVAKYRQGSGLEGRVKENTLKTLLDRPVGLKSVTNLSSATGGADPETMNEARNNAPSTVKTFGRAVSLADFEALVTSTGEAAKAKSTWLWDGLARTIHITVAAQQAGIFEQRDLARLHASLTTQRDPNYALQLANFVRIPIVITAHINIAADYFAQDVEQACRQMLLNALSFESLQFGQTIHRSDIYKILHEVEGVDYIDLEKFQFKENTPEYLANRGASEDAVQPYLRIYLARKDKNSGLVLPAEQAWIESPKNDIRFSTTGGLTR